MAERWNGPLAPPAVAIAAKKSGLRADQVERAVAEYRAATRDLHDEPEFRAVQHISGQGEAFAVYADPTGATKVALHIHSWKVRDSWKSERHYVFSGNGYESFGEAREVELLAQELPSPSPPNVVRLDRDDA